MPYKDPAIRKEYLKKYYLEHSNVKYGRTDRPKEKDGLEKERHRIQNRDKWRCKKLGLTGIMHHIKYHANNKDDTWLDDIIFFESEEEHYKYHLEHGYYGEVIFQ